MTLRAMSFFNIHSRWPYATQNVNPLSNHFQVPKINASSHSAEMVAAQLFRNQTDEQFIAKAMGHSSAAIPSHNTIALCGGRSLPQPASSFMVYLNFLQKARKLYKCFWECGILWVRHHCLLLGNVVLVGENLEGSRQPYLLYQKSHESSEQF
jgi:hypothetical protein